MTGEERQRQSEDQFIRELACDVVTLMQPQLKADVSRQSFRNFKKHLFFYLSKSCFVCLSMEQFCQKRIFQERQ
jgi:hypothetical protein